MVDSASAVTRRGLIDTLERDAAAAAGRGAPRDGLTGPVAGGFAAAGFLEGILTCFFAVIETFVPSCVRYHPNGSRRIASCCGYRRFNAWSKYRRASSIPRSPPVSKQYTAVAMVSAVR